MKRPDKKILMIFIEPTPYILDLLSKGFLDWKNKLEIVFLSENISFPKSGHIAIKNKWFKNKQIFVT